MAGNRRNEFNKNQKTLGIPWHNGSISTAKWTGFWLSDIIKYKDNQHIHFIGEDMPFATSILTNDLIKDNNDIMIAYKMNDLDIPLDQGYPLRIIAPGYAVQKCKMGKIYNYIR